MKFEILVLTREGEEYQNLRADILANYGYTAFYNIAKKKAITTEQFDRFELDIRKLHGIVKSDYDFTVKDLKSLKELSPYIKRTEDLILHINKMLRLKNLLEEVFCDLDNKEDKKWKNS